MLPPSPFAQHVAERLRGGERLLEVGCGNGRDAVFFGSHGLRVVALEASSAAISVCHRLSGRNGVEFQVGRLGDVALDLGGAFDIIYCRFVLHAMTPG